ncbi:translation initiation factor IF-2 [Gammaproteobacteria bacterium]|nr:translation initiation factor IF-2 [Gammaproteobacteria bacterium]MDA9570601.1 translation initiation factor IF-2 [Gammaproteobacteria bacterium]MDA9575360.1 translation initiation factor IF-2 [Gammaproteobacteria bacterium]MDA9805058.1 translation initiation factor IF-2 [Gammaproteobacteria bacterium]MDB2448151.1 translation initiation factor IF-2 [Gammaproteobacteria bacterium]
MTLTVKDFAKTLKISDSALLERMQNAGLSHSKSSDEITAADKQALLKSLKGAKATSPRSVTSGSGVTVTSKGKISKESEGTRSYSDNIEAKRAAASEQLKEQQKKREDQLKEAARLKQEEIKKRDKFKKVESEKPAIKVNVKDQLSSAVNAYKRREAAFPKDSEHKFEAPTEFIKKDIEVPSSIQVGELAKLMAVKGNIVVKNLMGLGVVANINDIIDQETAILVVEEIGHNGIALKEENFEEDLANLINYADEATSRSPVVTVMGHVDHGKTTLLDFIRKTKVVDGEAGGITQHIGAYEVETTKGKITFIDTPGHAAFSSMRARGANTTDIVILVVAANDGIKPQTEEAINHAKAAGVSIVVAINKIDLDGADIDKVKGDLAAKDLAPEDWGGTTQMVPVSALKGTGVDKLLESVSLEAELLELRAHHKGQAQGVVIESELDKFRGSVATFLIQNGTLKVGDLVASGNSIGKIKSIVNSDGTKIKNAGPSAAVEVLGLNNVPNAGDPFQVVENEKQAREIAEYRITKEKEKKLLKQKDDSAGDLFESLGQESKKVLNVIVKTDVGGTCEAIAASLNDLSNDLAKVKIVSSGVGGITESDANLALAVDSIILGFNVRADNSAKKIIEDESIPLSYHSIIYELLDDVKARMSGLLDPIIKEEIVGTAEVLEVFNSPKFGQIAGCNVIEGTVYKNKPVRVLRDEIVIFEGELDSLRRFKEDVNEVKNGTECGMGIKNYKDIKPGDKIEVYDRKEEAQSM